MKFFEGFLGEAFFQESSPKRVPYKSKFELSDVFSVAFLLLTFLFAKRKVRASFTITKNKENVNDTTPCFLVYLIFKSKTFSQSVNVKGYKSRKSHVIQNKHALSYDKSNDIQLNRKRRRLGKYKL